MPKSESYNDLIFQLGDLARERLAGKPTAPRSIERVLRAEQLLLTRRDELQEIEAQMNEADAAHQQRIAEAKAARPADEALVKKWRKAVDAIEGRVKGVRKKLSAIRADGRYAAGALKVAERKHAELEMTAGHDAARISLSKDNLK